MVRCNYHDVLELTGREPLWWDEHAVPRYVEFSPLENANVYAIEVALLLIRCQQCYKEFKVCVSSEPGDMTFRDKNTLAIKIENATIDYGDPPNAGCCAAGVTMNSVPIRVIEFWRREPSTALGWFRIRELEINVTPNWLERWERSNQE